MRTLNLLHWQPQQQVRYNILPKKKTLEAELGLGEEEKAKSNYTKKKKKTLIN